MSQEVHFMSERQDWGTPRAFLEWLETDRSWTPNLDAAASIRNAKAPHFFTEDDDSLSKDWFGDVWLNPPFGNELPKFMKKCAEQIKRKEVRSIMVLIPARTDTKWFHEIVMPHAYLIYLIKGRFNFRVDNAVEGANAPFPSMLVLYRKHRLPDAGITTLEVPKEARGFNGS
jgi:phage N-6-adenine-methyltransferase